MYKKLLLATVSVSFPVAAQAIDQPNRISAQTVAPVPANTQEDADTQRDAVPPKAIKQTQAPEPAITELEPVIVTSPLQSKRSEAAAPVTILSDEELSMKMGHSIGETLKQELGITSQSFVPVSARL